MAIKAPRKRKFRVTGATARRMKAVRSSGNRSTELRLVEILKSADVHGWRRTFRLYGKPDFVWPQERIALFVDGCFWHGCPSCYGAPRRNAAFWRKKIAYNREHDQRVSRRLKQSGWRVLRLRECQLKAPRSISRLRAMLRKPADRKTLLERAKKYVGAIKGPLKPRSIAAQAKSLIRAIALSKHARA